MYDLKDTYNWPAAEPSVDQTAISAQANVRKAHVIHKAFASTQVLRLVIQRRIHREKSTQKGRHKGHINIHPTTPDQNLPPEYSQYQPQTQAPPAVSGGKRGQVIDTLTPFQGNRADNNGCFTESNIGRSCRHVSTKIPPIGQNYGVYANFQTKSGGMDKDQPEISITSGGPGSDQVYVGYNYRNY